MISKEISKWWKYKGDSYSNAGRNRPLLYIPLQTKRSAEQIETAKGRLTPSCTHLYQLDLVSITNTAYFTYNYQSNVEMRKDKDSEKLYSNAGKNKSVLVP